jgi:hypothetical protein
MQRLRSAITLRDFGNEFCCGKARRVRVCGGSDVEYPERSNAHLFKARAEGNARRRGRLRLGTET